MGAVSIGDPQSLNHYAYTRNDPVNLTDPTGLMCIQFHFTNTATGEGFWTPWYCTPGTSNFEPKGGIHETGHTDPQNPDRRLTKDEYLTLREEMARALQSEKCRNFIDTLISYNSRQQFDSQKQFLDYGDAVFKNAGVFFSPGSIGGLRRQNREDYPKIFLGPEYRLDLNKVGFAATLMHELIHGLTIGSDDAIVRDLINLGIVPFDRDGKPLPYPKGENYDYNKYFDTAIKNACFPTLRN